jgi:hypothetical protein
LCEWAEFPLPIKKDTLERRRANEVGKTSRITFSPSLTIAKNGESWILKAIGFSLPSSIVVPAPGYASRMSSLHRED